MLQNCLVNTECNNVSLRSETAYNSVTPVHRIILTSRRVAMGDIYPHEGWKNFHMPSTFTSTYKARVQT